MKAFHIFIMPIWQLLLYMSVCVLLRWEMASKGCMCLNINTSKNHSISNILKPFGFLPSLHQVTFVAKFCHLSSSSHLDWCNILKECKHGEITWDSLQNNQRGSVEPGVDTCCISQPLGAENQPRSLRCYEEQDRKKWWKSRRSHWFGYLIVKSPLKLFPPHSASLQVLNDVAVINPRGWDHRRFTV